MLIFGSRMYGKKHQVAGVGPCEFCGAYGKHRSYEGRKFGHLYFIPLIPSGGRVRVMKECAACNMGRHVPVAQVGELYARVEALMQPCVVAAGEGQRSFSAPDTGETIYNGPFLMDAVELMVTAGYGGEVPGILGLFDDDTTRYEHGIADGAYQEIRGHDGAAYAAYERAMHAAPDQPVPYLLLADFQTRSGRHDEALSLLERALELEPDNVQIMLAMAGPLEALGRFQELTDLLDRAVTIAPALAGDKKFSKLRKKFAKKAAKSGG